MLTQRVVAAPGSAAGTYALYTTPDCTSSDPAAENLVVATQLIYNIQHKYATLLHMLYTLACVRAAVVLMLMTRGHAAMSPHARPQAPSTACCSKFSIGIKHMQCVSNCGNAWSTGNKNCVN